VLHKDRHDCGLLNKKVNPEASDVCRTALQRSSLWYTVVHECKLKELRDIAQPAVGYETLCGNHNKCNSALNAWHELVSERCGDEEIIPVTKLPPQMKRSLLAVRQEGPTIAGVVRPPLGYDLESLSLTASNVFEMVRFSLDAACTQNSENQPCLGLLNAKIASGAFNGTVPPLDQSSIAEAAMFIAQDPRFLCSECTTNLLSVLVEHKQSSLFGSLGMSIKVDQVAAKVQV
jgi:hypothetical protein